MDGNDIGCISPSPIPVSVSVQAEAEGEGEGKGEGEGEGEKEEGGAGKVELEGKGEYFNHLQRISVSSTHLASWGDIDAIADMPVLSNLRLSHIPLFAGRGASEVRELCCQGSCVFRGLYLYTTVVILHI